MNDNGVTLCRNILDTLALKLFIIDGGLMLSTQVLLFKHNKDLSSSQSSLPVLCVLIIDREPSFAERPDRKESVE